LFAARAQVPSAAVMNVLIALLLALESPVSPATQPSAVRGHDPWVFRCALDRRPRMVVVALTPGWWLAFDAGRGAIYKVWEGDVLFAGTVYDTRHGPQPEAIGETFFEGEPIRIVKSSGDAAFDVKWQWRGYRIDDGEVWFHIGCIAPDGREITIALTPRVVEQQGRATGIRIGIHVVGLRDDERAELTLINLNRQRVPSGRIAAPRPGGVHRSEPFQPGQRYRAQVRPDDHPFMLDLEIVDR
jgi:hypothetical protein